MTVRLCRPGAVSIVSVESGGSLPDGVRALLVKQLADRQIRTSLWARRLITMPLDRAVLGELALERVEEGGT